MDFKNQKHINSAKDGEPNAKNKNSKEPNALQKYKDKI